MFGSAAAAVVFPTPAQVLLRGSFRSSDDIGLDYTAPRQADPHAETVALSTDLVNAFFVELNVSSFPASDAPSPAEADREAAFAEVAPAQDEADTLVLANPYRAIRSTGATSTTSSAPWLGCCPRARVPA